MAVYIEPPYADVSNGQYVGVNIEIVTLIAQRLNRQVNFTECPFIRCMSLMRTGTVDLIVGIKKDKERAKYVSYLDEPYNVQYFPLNFYLLKDSNHNIKQYDDLKNLRIGTIRGALYFERFDRDNELLKTTVTTYEQLIKLLMRKRIDTFIEREESITPWVKSDVYNQRFKKAEYQYSKAVGSYIAVSKKSPLIKKIAQINEIQNQLIQTGAINQIFLHWSN
ncbi:substrate-binding periplasmic protein [Thalassotalea fusca]